MTTRPPLKRRRTKDVTLILSQTPPGMTDPKSDNETYIHADTDTDTDVHAHTDDPFLINQQHSLTECRALVHRIQGEAHTVAAAYIGQWETCLLALQASQTDYHALTQTHHHLIGQLEGSEKMIRRLRSVLRAKKEDIQLITQDRDFWEQSYIKEESAHRDTQGKLVAANERLVDEKLRKENEEYRHRIIELEKQNNRASSRIAAIQEETSRTHKANEDLLNRVNELKLRVERGSREKEDYQHQAVDLRKENDRLKSQPDGEMTRKESVVKPQVVAGGIRSALVDPEVRHHLNALKELLSLNRAELPHRTVVHQVVSGSDISNCTSNNVTSTEEIQKTCRSVGKS
ncbi:uncharacterized protein I303_103935 [Kwoniella dejecticola CBS 10117]|uniref:Uncharacterized protein n=1 Tax=Kwoniella dejecticola CBS 10117 TaxID=1296121 RepID=A0A1A6A850_9TREE|nr:uncharacterized protein I303_03952 [Kwoniella dejecticola CBS 10117]OBR86232.1 hypothetical protein I303_03952 [Kwoniella dejecticola CBS 10117]